MTADIRVGDVMVKNIPITDPDESMVNAAKTMKEEKVSALIVVSERGNPIGILTERDFVQKLIASQKDPDKTLVKDIMSSPVITTNPETTLEQAAEILQRYKIKRLPVVSKNKGDLVGVLSATTIVSMFPDLVEFAAREVELRAFGRTLDESLLKVKDALREDEELEEDYTYEEEISKEEY